MTTLLSALLYAGAIASTMPLDTTIVVPAGTRLDVSTQGGEIVVGTWTRNEVRIEADHGSRERIRVTTTGGVVRVRSESERGGPGIVDYRITVPAAMDLDLNGMYADISVTDTNGQIRAATVSGDIRVRGGGGEVVVETVQGDIDIENSRGSVRAQAVAGDVVIRNVTGSIVAAAVSGELSLLNVQSGDVDGSAVSGDVYFEGPVRANGRYSFVSHSGDVTIATSSRLDATVTMATMSGSLRSSFLSIAPEQGRGGRRQSFVLGNGSATIEAETFSGDVRIVEPGTRGGSL